MITVSVDRSEPVAVKERSNLALDSVKKGRLARSQFRAVDCRSGYRRNIFRTHRAYAYSHGTITHTSGDHIPTKDKGPSLLEEPVR
jgi:hypothetical protein